MHGRVKVRTTAEQEAIKKIEREKKVKQYKSAINKVFQKRKDQVYDDELLTLTELMVLENADITTIWNIRREAFEKNSWESDEYNERLKKELPLTMACLARNPKSYSVWHHRLWVIDHMSTPDWKAELALCTKYLDIDERNFHCWDYRQHLVENAGISDEEELKFSTTKIYKNFSNYSSWHYRSKLLPRIFPDESGQLSINSEKHKEELDFVMNATFTDPNDSSAWFYQRWLLYANDVQPKTPWLVKIVGDTATVIFHAITSRNFTLIKKRDNVEAFVISNWHSYNDQKYSKVWTASHLPESFLDWNDSYVMSIKKDGENDNYDLHKSDNEDIWYYKSVSVSTNVAKQTETQQQMENYKELANMEPSNKWVLLTGIFLMKNYDFIKYYNQILQDLSALTKIDNLRANYYADIRSKFIIDYKLSTQWRENDQKTDCIIGLSNLELTTLYNEHYFTLCEEMDLSGNQLNQSLNRLAVLQNCRKLSLERNKLKGLKNFPSLSKLDCLSLRNNELTSLDEILHLLKRHQLSSLDLRGNPLCNSEDTISQIKAIHQDLHLIWT